MEYGSQLDNFIICQDNRNMSTRFLPHTNPGLLVLWRELSKHVNIVGKCISATNHCDDVDNGLYNTCEVIRQETVLFSTPETDYIIYD